MFTYIKKYIKSHRRIIILAILSVSFFVLYSWYPYQTAKNTDFKFASPDEIANYFWAKRFVEMSLRGSVSPLRRSESEASDRSNPVANEKNDGIASSATRNDSALSYFEPLNLAAQDIVIPRSMRSDNGVVKPVSFLGIILIYGTIAKFLGMWIVPFLTPLFAIVGVLFFYGIVKKIFNERKALLSALMLFSLAPYWYYASRSMFHNVLFIDLLLIAIYFLINGTLIERIKRIKTDFIFVFLPGIFIGLAIITRVSELIWLAPAMLMVWLAYFRQIGWRKLTVFVCGVILALLPMFYYNQVLYGGFLKFGYNKPAAVETRSEIAVNNANTENINQIASPLRSAAGFLAMTKKFMPAQINFKQAGKSFIYYYILMFWYLFWPAFLGGVWFLWNWKKIDKTQKLYLTVFTISSAILGLYYGSWKIQDNPNPASFTIGNSYTRYFLPMYLMSLPLAAIFFLKFSELIKNKYGRYALLSVLMISFVFFNAQAAVFGKEEGLALVRQNIISDSQRTRKIDNLIENNAVIISERFDKLFWPKHKVIVGNLSDKSQPLAYAKLAEQGVPLYYYGFIFPPGDFAYLNSRKLVKVNLELEIIKVDESNRLALYKLMFVK